MFYTLLKERAYFAKSRRNLVKSNASAILFIKSHRETKESKKKRKSSCFSDNKPRGKSVLKRATRFQLKKTAKINSIM